MRGTKITIQFGLVSIPCKRGPVTKDSRVKAKRVCATHMTPVRQQYVCPDHDDHVVDEYVSAYEQTDGTFKAVDREELAVENDHALTLNAFVDDFSPAFYEKTELLHPQTGAESPHSVLSEALRQRGGMAVGEMVVNKARRQVGVRWDEALQCVTLHVLAFNHDVRWEDVDGGQPGAVDQSQVDMAIAILESLAEECELDAVDEYDERIRAAVESGARKVELKLVEADVPDLMEAMRQSVAEINARKEQVA